MLAAEKLEIVVREIKNRVSSHLTKQAAVDVKLPHVLETLVVHGRITPEQKSAAAALIRNPDTVLDFIEALARHRTPTELSSSLGTPVSSGSGFKKVAVESTPIDWDETEAGRAFRQAILGRS